MAAIPRVGLRVCLSACASVRGCLCLRRPACVSRVETLQRYCPTICPTNCPTNYPSKHVAYMVADHGCCWYGCCCTQVYTSGPAQVVAYRGCCCWYGHAGLQVELSGPAAPPDLYAADADTQAYRWNCQARVDGCLPWLLLLV